jgi:presenilin-like A22 family membrane protease
MHTSIIIAVAAPHLKRIILACGVLGSMCGGYIGLRRMDAVIAERRGFNPYMAFIPAGWVIVGFLLGSTGIVYPSALLYDAYTSCHHSCTQ